MTDPERPAGSFLERWSRKKIEGEREASGAPAESTAKAESPPDESGLPARAVDNDATVPPKAASKPEFDLESLPSLDSITAATDIRAFLGPGVPKELARAALRRAWSADPAIRDFKGLAENDWDFTNPTAMPGFGALPEGYDIKKLVAQIFGENEKPADPDAASGAPPGPQIPRMAEENASAPSAQQQAAPLPAGEGESGSAISAPDQQVALASIVQRDNNIASHHSNPDDDTEERKNRRPHGGALPQ